MTNLMRGGVELVEVEVGDMVVEMVVDLHVTLPGKLFRHIIF